MAEIGIGSTVWVFDDNSREYRKDASGRSIGGGPIYRSHWVPVTITGENRVSWLISRYERFSKIAPHQTKTTPYGFNRVATSQQEVDDDCWINGHRASIANHIFTVNDAAILRQIATLVGYTPEEER